MDKELRPLFWNFQGEEHSRQSCNQQTKVSLWIGAVLSIVYLSTIPDQRSRLFVSYDPQNMGGGGMSRPKVGLGCRLVTTAMCNRIQLDEVRWNNRGIIMWRSEAWQFVGFYSGEFPVQGGYLTLLRSGCANILRIRIGMRRLSVGDSDGSVEIRWWRNLRVRSGLPKKA